MCSCDGLLAPIIHRKLGIRHISNVIFDHSVRAGGTRIILAEYERAPDCVEALGTLNRWPGRSGVPIEDYLQQWEASCTELQASPHLPAHLREMLRIG